MATRGSALYMRGKFNMGLHKSTLRTPVPRQNKSCCDSQLEQHDMWNSTKFWYLWRLVGLWWCRFAVDVPTLRVAGFSQEAPKLPLGVSGVLLSVASIWEPLCPRWYIYSGMLYSDAICGSVTWILITVLALLNFGDNRNLAASFAMSKLVRLLLAGHARGYTMWKKPFRIRCCQFHQQKPLRI